MTHPTTLARRGFLEWTTRGLGAAAVLHLLQRDTPLKAARDSLHPLPSFAPRAKRAVHISLVGGLSHLDSFDHKPTLQKLHGKSLNTDEKPDIFFGKVGLLRKSDWAFQQRGESGLWLSDMFPNIAAQADHLTLIRSMVSESANHTPALFFANSGFESNGFPSVGSWLSYGLGNETDVLPTFVVLPDGRGGPNGGASNWTSGFLSAQHQGIVFGSGDQPVRDLFPGRKIPADTEQQLREFLDATSTEPPDQTGASTSLSTFTRVLKSTLCNDRFLYPRVGLHINTDHEARSS